MLKLFILGTVTLFARAQEDHPITAEKIERIKSEPKTWTPYELEENPFRNLSREEIIGMLGLKHTPAPPSDFLPLSHDQTDYKDVPENFDARDEWGNWIHEIRDQG